MKMEDNDVAIVCFLDILLFCFCLHIVVLFLFTYCCFVLLLFIHCLFCCCYCSRVVVSVSSWRF